MDQTTYTNNITEAISIIAQSEVAKIACDKTITCTIVDDTDKDQGKYRVSDGATEFYAFSDNTTYANDDVVYVTIPNGDYSQQKLIKGKKTSEDGEPYIYEEPFDSFLPCTPNLIDVNNKVGLIANGANEEKVGTSIGVWNKDQLSRYYKDFNRLGLRAKFQSLLGSQKVISGDYGLRLTIECDNGESESDSEYTLATENGYDKDRVYKNLSQTEVTKDENLETLSSVEIKEPYKPNNYRYIPLLQDTNEYPTDNRIYYEYDSTQYQRLCYVISYLDTNIWYKNNEATQKITLTANDIGTFVYNSNKQKCYVYKPETIYYVPEEYCVYNSSTGELEGFKTVLASENGYDKDSNYYTLNKVKLDVTENNFENLASNGKIGIEEDKTIKQLDLINEQYKAAKAQYKTWYYWSETQDTPWVERNIKNNYLESITNKDIYIVNNDKTYYLATDNGYNENYDYYYITYLPVDVTDNMDAKYYGLYIWNKDKYISVTGTVKANTQYYQRVYQFIVLDKNNYKPNYYYYLKQDKNNTQYLVDNVASLIDNVTYNKYEKFNLATDNGYNENYNYYEKNWIIEAEENKTKDNYETKKYYYKSTTSDKYYLIAVSGFDSTKIYYDYEAFSLANYNKIDLLAEDYQPDTYYYRKKNIITTSVVTYLNTDDMIGQVYNFAALNSQEVVFDISSISNITKMSLDFYEDGQFTTAENTRVETANSANLFINDIELYFGYDVSNLSEDNENYVQLFTYDSSTYKATTNSKENLKTIYLKWVHQEDDKNYIIDKDNISTLQVDELDKAATTLENNSGYVKTSDEFDLTIDTSIDAVEDRQYYRADLHSCTECWDADNNQLSYDKSDFTEEDQIYQADYYLNGNEEYNAERNYFQKLYIGVAAKQEDDIVIEKYSSMSYSLVSSGSELESETIYYKSYGSYYEKLGRGADLSSDGIAQEDLYTQVYTLAADPDEIIAYLIYRPLNNTTVQLYSSSELFYLYYDKFTKIDKDSITADNIERCYWIQYNTIDSADYISSKYYYITVADTDLSINWYRYELGAAAADEYCGVYWTKIDNTDALADNTYLIDDFTLCLAPDTVYNEVEKIKAIIIYNDEPLVSNIIEFTNESPVANLPTLQQENALRISYADGSLGNYYVYGEDNALLSSDEGQEVRTIKLLFDLNDFTSSSLLTSAESVEWIFPTVDTMINVNTSQTVGTYSESNGVGRIKNTVASAQEYSLAYSIDNYYSYSKNNNVITCNIYKDGILYSTTAQFSFGQSGSNGTEYTLELDLQEPDGVVTINGSANSAGLYYLSFGAVEQSDWQNNADSLYNKILDATGLTVYEPITVAEAYELGLTTLYTQNTYISIEYDIPQASDFVSKPEDMSKFYYLQNTKDYVEDTKTIVDYLDIIYDQDNLSTSEKKTYIEAIFTGSSITDENGVLTLAKKEEKQYYIPVETKNYYSVTRTYYRLDGENFVQTNVSNVGGDVIVVANLYDQNHQALNIKDYSVTWSWLTTSQELFTIQNNDYNSIILQQNNLTDTDPMNQLCILQASLTFGGVDLIACLPIPLRNNYAPVKYQGPTKIIYSTTGTPNYYKNAIKLFYNDTEGELQEYSLSFNDTDNNQEFSIISDEDVKYLPEIIDDEDSEEQTLQAKSLYVDGLKPFGIQYKDNNGDVIWTQPILYMQNRYFSSTLNNWDGSLSVDEDENSILAKSIAAGKKNSDNTFSGVIIGDWTDNTNANDEGNKAIADTVHSALGIYGIHEGATSFGFTENGTGFIGKSGNGRIIFDGNDSIITSGNWYNNRQGLYFDIDDGFILAQREDGQYIKINAKATADKYIGDNFSGSFQSPSMIPKAGDNQDSDYPFVIRGDDENYVKLGWKGDLILHGSHSGLDLGETDADSYNYGISLSASAKTYPLNISDHFAAMWDGSLLLSANDISSTYGSEDDNTTRQYTNVYGRGITKQIVNTEIVEWEDLAGLSNAANENTGDDKFTLVGSKKRYNYTARASRENDKKSIYEYLLLDTNISSIDDFISKYFSENGYKYSISENKLSEDKEYCIQQQNNYDYTEINNSFEGFYGTPYGDLYLSKKLVIGNNFSANRDGYLRAEEALFENCNADTFVIKYLEQTGADGSTNLYNTIDKKQYLSLVYGNPHFTPTAGTIGYVQGAITYSNTNNTGGNINDDSTSISSTTTHNIGIQSYNDFGIKINSNTNISLKARTKRIKEQVPNGEVDVPKEAGLFSKTGQKKLFEVGGIYLEGRKIECNANQNINLITTFDDDYITNILKDNNDITLNSLPNSYSYIDLINNLNIKVSSDNLIDASGIGFKFLGNVQPDRRTINNYNINEDILAGILNKDSASEVEIYESGEALKADDGTVYNNPSVGQPSGTFSSFENKNYINKIGDYYTAYYDADILGDLKVYFLPGYISLSAGDKYKFRIREFSKLYEKEYNYDDGFTVALGQSHRDVYSGEYTSWGGSNSYIRIGQDEIPSSPVNPEFKDETTSTESEDDIAAFSEDEDNSSTNKSTILNTVKIVGEQIQCESESNSGVISLGLYGIDSSAKSKMARRVASMRLTYDNAVLWSGNQTTISRGGNQSTTRIRLFGVKDTDDVLTPTNSNFGSSAKEYASASIGIEASGGDVSIYGNKKVMLFNGGAKLGYTDLTSNSTSTTHYIALDSSATRIYSVNAMNLYSGEALMAQSAATMNLDAVGQLTINSSTKIELTGGALNSTIEAANQTGIYARFA